LYHLCFPLLVCAYRASALFLPPKKSPTSVHRARLFFVRESFPFYSLLCLTNAATPLWDWSFFFRVFFFLALSRHKVRHGVERACTPPLLVIFFRALDQFFPVGRPRVSERSLTFNFQTSVQPSNSPPPQSYSFL